MDARLGPPAVLAVGAAVAGYATYEARQPRLRRFDVPILPAGRHPFRILHLSDLHLTPRQGWKIDWIRDLARLTPDLIVDTGDNLAHHLAVPAVLRALEPLLAFPGVFVWGSNDYFAPVWKNPARYLLPHAPRKLTGDRLPWPRLRDELTDAGWVDATNRRRLRTVSGLAVDVAGVGDAHIGADRYQQVAGPVAADVDVALGLSHTPEPRVLDRFASDGFRLVLSGHTHGGQLRVPGLGALVTNCGLDTKRARGLSRWDPACWLHVSAGLGTSPYTPVRFACPPEATLLSLQPVADQPIH